MSKTNTKKILYTIGIFTILSFGIVYAYTSVKDSLTFLRGAGDTGHIGYIIKELFYDSGALEGKIKKDYLELPDSLIFIDSTGSTLTTQAPTINILTQVWTSLYSMIGNQNTNIALKSDKTTAISAGSGLSGGGDLSANRTLSINTTSISTCTGSTQKILWDSTNNRFNCGADIDTNINYIAGNGLSLSGTEFSLNLINSTGSTSLTNAPTAGIIKSMWEHLESKINGKISGSGADGYLPKFVGTGSITYSNVYDNGTNIGIGMNAPTERLEVVGNLKLGGSTPTYRIINIAKPVANNDAANKAYVDSAVSAWSSSDTTYLENGSYYSEGGQPYFCRLNTLEGTTQRIISINQNKQCDSASNLYCNAGNCNADSSILETIKQTHQLISTRDHQSCSISDGQVYCWGYSGNGQKYQDMSMSSGNSSYEGHSCTVLGDGRVSCWGTNNYGQLGVGNQNVYYEPVIVSGITNAVKVYTASSGNSTNYGRSCALLTDGTVKCWGQLPHYSQTSSPIVISGLTGVVDFSMSQENASANGHWCAVINDGTIKCAGTGNYGQLGDGTNNSRDWINTPVTVTGISNAVKIYTASSGHSTNYGYSCALLSGGGLKCWGKVNRGSGDVFYTPVNLFGQISNLSLSSGNNNSDGHSCFIGSGSTAGKVYCMGTGNYGQLGNGYSNTSTYPVEVSGIINAVKVYTASSGNSTNYGRTCALLSDQTVKCWGQLPGATSYNTPQTITGLTGVVDFSMSQENSSAEGHWCAVLSSGEVKCAGTGNYGQLGNGVASGTNWISGSVTVTGISNAVKIYTVSSGHSTNYGRSCALLTDQTVKCWGQLPSATSYNTPQTITGLTGVVDFSMSQENSYAHGHWCAVLSSGEVKCAGTGGFGQLGDGTVNSRDWINTPVTVTGISNASKIYTASAGYSTNYGRSCALLSDQTVKCWGYLPNTGQNNSPASITGLTGVIDFSMSQESADPSGHWCAVLSSGAVKCAGTGNYGQLGDGTVNNRDWINTPVTVIGISNAVKIYTASSGYSTNYGYSCALLSDGGLKCWGAVNRGSATTYNIPVNLFGQISNGSLSSGNSDAYGHSCFIGSGISAGKVYCMGTGNYGQLGNGYLYNSPYPVEVSGITNAVKVYTASSGYSTNYGRSCALLADGTVKCWGQLPNYSNISIPLSITGLTGVIDFSMSQENSNAEGHWCAVLNTGVVKCAGIGSYGQLGNGASSGTNWISGAVTVSNISNAVKVYTGSAGYSTNYGWSCATLQNGQIKCWGYNGNKGRLGFNSSSDTSFNTPQTVTTGNGIYYNGIGSVTVDKTIPEVKEGITAATSISAGAYHACAIEGGTVRCWGYNAEGQLGNNSSNASTVPVGVFGLSTAKQLASGYMHTCAVLVDGTVKCWGLNRYGQLGNGSQTSSTTPVTVTGISNAKEISAGDYHTCVVLTDGTVKCWGLNDKYQLGSNTGSLLVSTPSLVSGISGVTRITSGEKHNCIIASGVIKCWGAGDWGQLGNGGYVDKIETPTSVPGITTALRVGAGDYHTCAVLSDTTMRCWGLNHMSQQASTAYYSTKDVANLLGTQNILTVVGGNMHTCVISTDLGNLNCFGGNVHGQLGIGNMNTTSNVALVTYPIDDSSGVANYTLALCETRDSYNGNIGGVDGANAICQTQCGQGYVFARESEMANFGVSAETTNTYWIDRSQNTSTNCQNRTDSTSSYNGSIVKFNYNASNVVNYTAIPIGNGVTVSQVTCNNTKQLMCVRGVR